MTNPDDTFSDLVEAAPRSCAVLLDSAGRIIAGSTRKADGTDLPGETMAAALEVFNDAHRVMPHLAVGRWSAIVCESEGGVLGFAPAGSGAAAFVAADHPATAGYARRLLGKVAARGASGTART